MFGKALLQSTDLTASADEAIKVGTLGEPILKHL